MVCYDKKKRFPSQRRRIIQKHDDGKMKKLSIETIFLNFFSDELILK